MLASALDIEVHKAALLSEGDAMMQTRRRFAPQKSPAQVHVEWKPCDNARWNVCRPPAVARAGLSVTHGGEGVQGRDDFRELLQLAGRQQVHLVQQHEVRTPAVQRPQSVMAVQAAGAAAKRRSR